VPSIMNSSLTAWSLLTGVRVSGTLTKTGAPEALNII